MFQYEILYFSFRNRYGRRAALCDVGVITGGYLHTPVDRSKYDPVIDALVVFEKNDVFLELCNPQDDLHDTGLIMGVPILLLIFMNIIMLVQGGFALIFGVYPGKPWITVEWWDGVLDIIMSLPLLIGVMVACKYFCWPNYIRPSCFTMLRGRIRFNRVTRKVYVLRPKFCGGNAVLDWDRVRAQLHWQSFDDLSTGIHWKRPINLESMRRVGEDWDRSLVLYWPPFDENDPDAKGEDVVFVGPTVKYDWTGPIWEYIRRYMEEGAEAVPEPPPSARLPRGHLTLGELWSTYWVPKDEFRRQIRKAKEDGLDVSPEIQYVAGRNLMDYLGAPMHVIMTGLYQWLCYWPEFPKEWNSDSGVGERGWDMRAHP